MLLYTVRFWLIYTRDCIRRPDREYVIAYVCVRFTQIKVFVRVRARSYSVSFDGRKSLLFGVPLSVIILPAIIRFRRDVNYSRFSERRIFVILLLCSDVNKRFSRRRIQTRAVATTVDTISRFPSFERSKWTENNRQIADLRVYEMRGH